MSKAIPFGWAPRFGSVWRDTDSGVVVMWLIAVFEEGRATGTAVVLENPDPLGYWGQQGAIEDAVSWMYVGWERLDG